LGVGIWDRIWRRLWWLMGLVLMLDELLFRRKYVLMGIVDTFLMSWRWSLIWDVWDIRVKVIWALMGFARMAISEACFKEGSSNFRHVFLPPLKLWGFCKTCAIYQPVQKRLLVSHPLKPLTPDIIQVAVIPQSNPITCPFPRQHSINPQILLRLTPNKPPPPFSKLLFREGNRLKRRMVEWWSFEMRGRWGWILVRGGGGIESKLGSKLYLRGK
jgi:hypothetical protein